MKEVTVNRIQYLLEGIGIIIAGVIIALACTGCTTGTKYANTAGTYELEKNNTAVVNIQKFVNFEVDGAVDAYNMLVTGQTRMNKLQEARNSAEGMMINVPLNDKLLDLAIFELTKQKANNNTMKTAVNTAGSFALGGYWKEIAGILIAVGTVVVQQYRVKKSQSAEIEAKQGIGVLVKAVENGVQTKGIKDEVKAAEHPMIEAIVKSMK